jgi:hypothetical protein
LKTLVCLACKLQFCEVVSPEWLMNGGSQSGYDVAARIPAGTDREQYRLMLQKLLAERFHLVLHRETSPPGPPSAMTVVDGHLRFSLHNQPLATLANLLTVPLGAPVTGETGLQDDFNLSLDFMPDERWVALGLTPRQE